MPDTKEKAAHFLTALLDVYRDEDNRELGALPKLKFADDFTGDLTAMLLAVKVIADQLAGYDGDLIDFTHVLNKLAIQYVLENQGEIEDA